METPLLMFAFWHKHSNLMDNSMVAVSFAMAANWMLKNDYKMARIAAKNGLFLDSVGAAG
jgi:hypothetical protein